MKRTILFGYCLLLAQFVQAQVPANVYNTTSNQNQSLHATNSIELGNGFSSTSNIAITIIPSLNSAGQWATVSSWGEFIGIHTHVLPNGNVLSWQGHNDDDDKAMHMGTNAYLWNTTLTSSQPPDFHLDWTNAFCTGHSFLADGKLLVTGGHFGNIYQNVGGNPVFWYIQGLRHTSTYDYLGTAVTSTSPMAVGWHRESDMARNR